MESHAYLFCFFGVCRHFEGVEGHLVFRERLKQTSCQCARSEIDQIFLKCNKKGQRSSIDEFFLHLYQML